MDDARDRDKALQRIADMIARSERAQAKFAPGAAAHTLQRNRIHALCVAAALIRQAAGCEGAIAYTKEDLERARAPLASLISKSEKARQKLSPGTWQHNMLTNNLRALHWAEALLSKALVAGFDDQNEELEWDLMQKIAPCVWYDRDALAAAELYVSAFEDSRIESVTHYLEDNPFPSDVPAGMPLTVRFTLCGQEFNALNGGPVFKPTPAVSFFVDCQSEAQMDALWGRLSDGGFVLMEAQEYPFSKKFGWLADRFGVSWQLSFSGQKQKISPYLMFTEGVFGKAEEAMRFYSGLFGAANAPDIRRHGSDAGAAEGTVLFANFELAGQPFMAADSAYPHGFTFNEGISFYVYCRDQAEIDRFWDRLADGGEAQPCGWLKDRFGVSWQIVPHNIERLGDSADPARAGRVNAALMKMTKIDLQALQDAYDGLP